MSQTSRTITEIALIAMLTNGCALAPFSSVGDSLSEDASGHVESSASAGSESALRVDESSDRLSARLQEIEASDPERFAQIQSLLDTTESELPSDLRAAVREQFEAMLLEEAPRLEDRPGQDDIQLMKWSPPKRPAPNSIAPWRMDPRAKTMSSDVAPANRLVSETAATQKSGVRAPDATSATPSADATVNAAITTPSNDRETPAEDRDTMPGDWKGQLQSTADALERELARFDLEEDQAARWRTYLRLLRVIDNQRERAVEPIDGLSEDERQYWKHLLYGLLVSLDEEGMHATSRRAALALRDLRAAENHLANISSLDIKSLAFCTEVYSYGRVVEFDSRTFRPGQDVLLYVEIENFAVDQKGDEYETHLMSEYSVFDSRGIRIASAALPSDKQLCKNRRRDYFIAYPLSIPNDLPPGSFTIQLTVEDVVGKKSNLATIDFRVR